MRLRPPITFDGTSLKLGEKRLFLHSGEIHHFRTQPEQWEDSLKKIKAANLNAISVYVPWNWHEVEDTSAS
jgi:beta-galactosidase